MQRMISHARPLPPCRAGHTARHIHDQRAVRAGGGHFVECACRQGGRFAEYGVALADWCAINGHARPLPITSGTTAHVFRFRKKPA